MEDALLGDDGADQERDQQNDRHRAPADVVEVVHHRGEAKPARMRDHAREAPTISAPSMLSDQRRGLADIGHGAADRIERVDDADCRGAGARARSVDPLHLVDQRA